jgi:uncharacterized protein
MMVTPLVLLFFSNIFMTFAWYGHLKGFKTSPIWMVILLSWGIAFFEYTLQVPANRWGSEHYSLAQLKIIQEVITMIVFSGFALFYMKETLRWDYLWASFCLIGAVYFIFRNH